jgi:hypothetical protein
MPTHHGTDVTVSEAAQLAEALLGRHPERLEPFRAAYGGDTSVNFRLWVQGQRKLLKVSTRPGMPIGAYFHSRLRDGGIPVPDLLAFSADGGPGGTACGVFEWIEGTPAEFDSHQRPPYDEGDFGRLLRAIHDLRHTPGFGRLDDDGRTSHERWGDWITQLIANSVATCSDRGVFGQRLGESLCRLPQRFAAEIAAAPPALLHYEDIMHNGNLIVDPDSRRILAVVDFSGGMVGDPRLELAWVDLYFGAYGYFGRGFDLTRFREGYGDDGNLRDPTRLLYVCLALTTMLTYVDSASARGQHHLNLLKETVSAISG